MLKHLYKTLLISVISGSLLSFSPAIALAADGQTQTTTDNSGVITAKKNHKFDKISDADMMASLTMLGAGFVTARMAFVYNKPLSMDAMMAGAAGAAFVAGEVMSNVKFKGTIEEMTIEVEKKNDGTVNEDQIKRLEDLKKSYEEAKKTTNVKKMLQLASAAGFAAAAATAGYFAYLEYSQVTECLAALSVMQLNCPETKPYFVTMGELNIQRATPKSSLMSESGNKLNLPYMNTLIACTPKAGADTALVINQVAAANAVCPATVAMLKKHQVFTYYSPDKIVTEVNDSIKNTLFKKNSLLTNAFIETPKNTFVDNVLNFFIPKAEAGWMQMLGLPSGIGLAFLATTFGIAKEIDLWIYVPFNRTKIFSVLAGLAFLSSLSSARVMKKLDDNIAKIDAILADLNKLSKGIKAQNITQQGIKIATVNPGVATGVSFSTDNSVKTPCMSNNSSENCAPLANQLSSMPGFANLPDSFKDIATQTVAVGDGVSGKTGISGSTLATAESLGNKQNAIAKLLRSTQERLNKVSNGKLNSEKGADKFSKSMAATLRKSLEKSGMTATGLMSSIGSTPIDSSLKKDIETAPGNKLSAATNAVNIQDGAGSDKDAQSLKLDFKEQTPGDGLSMGEVTSSGGAAKEYDIKSPEINGEFGPSLFELISGRYLKSGYPKLLEEEPSKN